MNSEYFHIKFCELNPIFFNKQVEMKGADKKKLKRITEFLYEIMWVDESTNDYGFILPEDKRHHINCEINEKYRIHSKRTLFAYKDQGVK